MGIVSLSIVYIMIWWLIFLMVLSIGVTPIQNDEDRPAGTAPSAPQNPNIGKKMLWASLGAILPTLLIFIAVEADLIRYIPLPSYE